MSWLAGIAGKAEELLNKVDQAAATTLSNSVIEEEGGSHPTNKAFQSEKNNAFISHAKSHSSGGQLTGVAASLGSSASVPSNLNHMNSSQDYLSQLSKPRLSTTGTTAKPSSSKNNKQETDDELFKFLNSPETSSKRSSNGSTKNQLVNKPQHSRKSSTSSVGSKGRKTPDAASVGDNSTPGTPVMDNKIDRGATPENSTGDKEGSDSPDHASLDIQEEMMTRDSSSGYHSNPEDNNGTQQQLSSLELENGLLKNEVSSLNQEMASVIQRAKSAQDELVQVKKQLQSQTASHSQSDQMIRELRARENDLTEALTVKDTQLGVLRVRLEEADKEIQAKNKTIDSLSAKKKKVPTATLR